MESIRMPKTFSLIALACVAMFCGCPRPQVSAVRVSPDNAVAIRNALGAGKSADAAGSGAQAPQPTGWATIRGKFTLDGSPPTRLPLAITKDMQICAPGGKQVLSEELVVGDDGGIKDVVVYLTTKIPLDDPVFIHPDYDATKTAEVVFDQKQCVFLTHMFAARTTQNIVLKNSDPIGHNTNIVGKGAASTNVTIAENDTTSYVPGKESPEPFDVSCSVHPWMSAKMLIRDTPYFAATKEDGTFEIPNVPAGIKLDFRIWQERLKFIQSGKLNGEDAKWPRKGYQVTLQPDETHQMDVAVAAPAQ
jgi:hypothetical protein